MNTYLRKGLAMIGSFLAGIAILLPTSVHAQLEDSMSNDEFPGTMGDSSDLIFSLLKVIFVLIIIIGLIYFTLKFLARKNQSWFGKRSVRVLSGVQLAPNKSLQIVEVGGSVYVLGVGDDVRLLDKISDPELADMLIDQFSVQESQAIGTSVGQWLTRWRERREGSDATSDESFQDIFRDRLDRVSGQGRRVEDLLSDYAEDEKERSRHEK